MPIEILLDEEGPHRSSYGTADTDGRRERKIFFRAARTAWELRIRIFRDGGWEWDLLYWSSKGHFQAVFYSVPRTAAPEDLNVFLQDIVEKATMVVDGN